MLRRKLKSMCGLTLAFVLAANVTPVVSYAVTNEEGNLEGAISNPEYMTKDNSQVLEKKIVDGVDTETNDEISVIVEFISPSIAEGVAKNGQARTLTESKVERDHSIFNEFINSMPSKYNSTGQTSISYEYREVFNGVSLSINGADVENLLDCSVVKTIYPNEIIQLDIPEELKLNDEGIANLPEGRMGDSVPHIGADELHTEGITGKGIKVGVLDTGIDYNHPDLTNAYKGFRDGQGEANSQDIDSTLGWDFIDNDADPMETTYEDWIGSGQPEFDIMGGAFYTSHGTHVSGTIAGKAENTENSMAVKGVAPDVDLYGYRVLGPYGSGSTDGIIAAVEKSVKDGMDVINMSLGSSSGTPYNPMVTAVNNASLAGVVTIIANGNAGPGASTVGSPATAQLPIAVGASTTPTILSKYDLEIEGGVKLTSANHVVKDFDKSLDDNYGVEYEAIYCGLGTVSDFEGKDLTGKVALVDRGDIYFTEKSKNAKAAGAEYVIIMNNTTDTEIPNQGEHKAANAIAVNMAEGESIKSTLNSDGVTRITLNKLSEDLISGDSLADFSSTGPVIESDEIRPDIIAPGHQTFSTVPEFINDKNIEVDDYSGAYGRMSGTSMAAPHIAGVAALILQENPEYTPEDVKAVMMNTSEDVNQFREDEYSVHQQGAGRVNAYEAVYEDTHITVEHNVVDGSDYRELTHETGLLFFGKYTRELENPTDKSGSLPFNIENNSEVEKTYNIRVKYSKSERANDSEANGVTIDLDETVTVAPNSEANLEAVLNIPGSADTGTYEGYVIVEDTSNNKDYQLPFAVAYKSAGFENLAFPKLLGGVAEGITAVTSSDLYNRDGSMNDLFSDVEILVRINESVSKIYTFVKDKETGEYLGYSGGDMDASWIKNGVDSSIPGLVPNGRVKKLKGDKITNEHILLDDGAYDLEIIAIRPDGSSFSGTLPIGIINDNTQNEMTVNLEPGVTEVTEDMYTDELWADGKVYNALWIEGNVSHPLMDEIQSDYDGKINQSEVNQPVFTYPSDSGVPYVLNPWGKENGDFLLAGIEKSDLEKGPFAMSGKMINAGMVASRPEPYILINEGESYVAFEVEEKEVKTGENFAASIALNNVEDIVSGTIELFDYGYGINSIVDIKPTPEFKALLDENNSSVNIDFEALENSPFDPVESTTTRINFEIVGDNNISINGDLNLFDITYTASELRGMGEQIIEEDTFNGNEITCKSSSFVNSAGDEVSVENKTVLDFINVLDREKTIISGVFTFGGYDSDDIEIYALDPEGNRYDVSRKSAFGYNVSYVFDELPVIDGEYKIYANSLGHFGAIANVKGGEYSGNELIGTQVSLSSQSGSSPTIAATVGDANEDGAIDMHDMKILLNELGNNVENREGYAPDFNRDGIVDENDILKLLPNYGMQDFNREEVKEPEFIVDGDDIIDALEELGLFEENGTGYAIYLDKELESSLVGETIRFTADTEFATSFYTFKFFTRKIGEDQWNLVREESQDPVFNWTPEEAGEYEVKVRATHPGGQVIQDTISHNVESLDSIVTSPVREFKANTVNKKNVIVEWTAPENTKGLTGYVLYKDGKKVGEIDANTTSYEFKGLKRHTIYNFKVAAKYANGELSSKESITLRTKR